MYNRKHDCQANIGEGGGIRERGGWQRDDSESKWGGEWEQMTSQRLTSSSGESAKGESAKVICG
jgi:hypothetical protein